MWISLAGGSRGTVEGGIIQSIKASFSFNTVYLLAKKRHELREAESPSQAVRLCEPEHKAHT